MSTSRSPSCRSSLLDRLVVESRAARPEGRRQADVTGAVLGTVGLSGVVFGFISAGNHSWGNPQVWVPLLVGGLAAAAFILPERAPRPSPWCRPASSATPPG